MKLEKNSTNQSSKLLSQNPFLLSLGVGLVVFALSVLGIATRPQGLLAAFWPANAALMGLFVRFPKLNHPLSWMMAIIGYMLADAVFGTPLSVSWFLTLGNLVGVATGSWLYSYQSSSVRQLREPSAVLYLLLISTVSAALAGLVGMIGYPIFWGGTHFQGFAYWFSTELVNYLALLPLMLTIPEVKLKERRLNQYFYRLDKQKFMALASLIAGLLLGLAVGGPGALSFLIPGLLWCAITYSVFATTVIILVSSTWVLVLVSTGTLNLGVDVRDFYVLESFRLGVTFIMLSPLTVACAMLARNNLVRELAYTASHDHLTHALNRVGFYSRVGEIEAAGKNYSLFLCDIDFFKQVNDNYGHEAGDIVLTELSRRVADSLREEDIFARVGGEEFCVVLPDCSKTTALAIADRVRHRCADEPYFYKKTELNITISVGLFYSTDNPITIDKALKRADKALYKAKRNGRDQVAVF